MTEQTMVTQEMCKLHRELVEAKIGALKDKDNILENRMCGIEKGIEDVRALQKTILYTIIFVAFATVTTLMGVILGRGIDFGWLIP